jgi:choice-of-anchor B domain-containing protein
MIKKRLAFRAARVAAGVSCVIAAAGTCRSVRADDDDKKLLSKQPAVVAPIYREPVDPWKVASRVNANPNAGLGDDVFQFRNVSLKSWIPLSNFGGFTSGSSGADCWGYTSPSGREYALMGLSWGNGIVEVTDPTSPVIRPTVAGGVNVLWRDITVVGNYAYAVSDSQGVGVQVLDLSQIDAGTVTLVRNYSQGGHTTTHTLLANPASGWLYACGGNMANGGFKPMSLNDPTFPTFTANPWTTSYVHEALIESYTSGPYAGKEIAFLFRGSSSSKVSIVDVTNKASLVTLSSISYPGSNYSHQGWLTPDKKYLYHNDEVDGPNQSVPRMLTRVFDVSDLSTPRLVSVFTNGLASVDHNEYTRGRYLYQSNYTTGLRVWDISNPLKPYEVAFFDTRPEDDGTGYNGAWGNYAYFNSDTLLISDLERGLFIVKLSLLEMSLPAALPATLAPNQATPVSVHVNAREATTGDVVLMASVNGGPYADYPMSAQGGGVYSGNLPPVACNDRVRFYFQATSVEATPRQFTWPLAAATGDVFTAYAQTGETTVFSDDFQSDRGWTVQSDAGLTSGGWTRAVPLYNGGPGAVIGDADSSGSCFVTSNTLNGDVDGGATRLLSPALDLSASPEARITYSRWLVSLVGTADSLVTEVSNNNGGSWTTVNSVTPATGGWQQVTFRVADYVNPTAQTRVRFTVSDTDSSTTEAGIDAFSVIAPSCGTVCYVNCDQSTVAPVLNINDFICFQQRYSAGDTYANCDGSTTLPLLNINDFICFQQLYAAGCP